MQARFIFISILLIFCAEKFLAQTNRINYNSQNLFLSGTNLAWVNYAFDIGPGQTDFKTFGEYFLAFHDRGGNSVRWWLHTNGMNSPEFNKDGFVVSPGKGTIEDMKKVLDLAWERETGVILCLWSFDMMRSTLSADELNRNRLLLSDTVYTRAYINNCLIPMVDSLKGHPAIIAWEIFNEPEGMSSEFGWSFTSHVPMSAIQSFINLCAGAIHRSDPNALVTNGAVSISTLTDVPAPLSKTSEILAGMSYSEIAEMENIFYRKYGVRLSAEEIIGHFANITAANYNYYSDERLIQSGGDREGKLDLYTFHFYDWQSKTISPFYKSASTWNPDKPMAVTEFHIKDTQEIPARSLYPILFANGYCGALAWSWTDNAVTQKDQILSAMQLMWDQHRADVDVNGIGGDWPVVSISSPVDGSSFPENSEISLTAFAYDPDGSVSSVKFFAEDTLLVGEISAPPYSLTWKPASPGIYRITASAYDNQNHERISSPVKITVGTPTTFRIEAESGAIAGSGISIKSDVNASGGAYIDIAAQIGTITWNTPGVNKAGNYELRFTGRLHYASPKEQYINVNGSRAGTLRFEGSGSGWIEVPISADLNVGINQIQMELSWGWMYLDFFSIPREIITRAEETVTLPAEFILYQNYPNPFNPETTIKFSIPLDVGTPHGAALRTVIKIYDVLGRTVATLINEAKAPGLYEVKFNGNNLASGVYFVRLSRGNNSVVKSMVLLK